MNILILIVLACLLLPSTNDESNSHNEYIDNMTKSELDYYLRNNGLTEYKDYSIDTQKEKLKERCSYFNN